jgi:16S rRNA (guanine527-N7)-methyltransferase
MRAAVNDRPVRTALGAGGFARLMRVPRETMSCLDEYVALLAAWNRRINLVGASTMGDPWRRHILDSAQLRAHVPPAARVLVDIGSGAGLPGLVLSLLGVPEVHLIESDQRKAAFLREAVRVSGAAATLHAQRAERISGISADVVTARALAKLPDLLDIVVPFLQPHSICLFLKGRTAQEELDAAAKDWRFEAELVPSVSDPGGQLMILKSVARAPRP